MKKGQSLIELLLVIGLSALLLPAILTGFVSSREGKPQQQQRLGASALLKEAGDAVRSVRDNSGWNALPAADGSTVYYHHINASGAWQLLPVADQTNGQTMNGFLEKIIIYPVKRNPSGVIDPSGTTDPSTNKFVITISWTQPYSSSISSTLYLTRQENISLLETTQNDFSQGTPTSVIAHSPSNNPTSTDGEVILSGGGGGDWCGPGTPQVTLDLNGQGEARGVVAGVDRAYVGTGQNASGKAFYNVQVNTTGATPTATCTSPTCLYDPTPSMKTNDVFGEAIGAKRYAYLATDSNSREVAVLDVTNAAPALLQNIDVPGNINGKSVFVEGNILYVTTSDNKLYTYQLTADRTGVVPNGSNQYRGVISLAATGNNIYVVNGIVFIAMNSSAKQLQIVDATNPQSLSAKGNIQVNNQTVAQDVYARSDGQRAYLVTSVSTNAGVSEFYIIDTHDINNLSIKAQYDTSANGNMDPKAVTLVSGGKAIIVGYGGDQYIVFQNVDEDELDICGHITVPGLNINGVSSVIGTNGKAYSYIITEDASKELQIIEGGPGGQFSTTGTYLSKTYSFSQPTAFNRLITTVNQPIAGATVQLQVGVATGNPSAPYCNGVTYTYLGPDPSSPTGYSATGFYKTTTTGVSTIVGPIPFDNPAGSYNNPGRCFSYKAILNTTDPTQTPHLLDTTINYSP